MEDGNLAGAGPDKVTVSLVQPLEHNMVLAVPALIRVPELRQGRQQGSWEVPYAVEEQAIYCNAEKEPECEAPHEKTACVDAAANISRFHKRQCYPSRPHRAGRGRVPACAIRLV